MRRLVLLVLTLVFVVTLAPPQVLHAQSCGAAPAPRLTVGGSAYVAFTDGLPINLRDQPTRSGALIAQLPEGSTFEVLEGPVCADEIHWWRVQAADTAGWVAEGLEGEYFVAPGAFSREIDLAGLADIPVDDDCGSLPTRSDSPYFYFEPEANITLVLPPFGSDTEPIRLGNNDWVASYSDPICRSGDLWWEVEGAYYGELPETLNGEYMLKPLVFDPVPPVALDVPLTAPVISSPAVPLPTITPDQSIAVSAFSDWTWNGANDPTQLILPAAYAGDLPALPVDLNTVHFVADAGLSDAQLALLAQNGFVVVPGDYMQMDEVYMDGTWLSEEGKADFVSTDMLLHVLYIVYENTLKLLEIDQFISLGIQWTAESFQAAYAQYDVLASSPLQESARRAAVFYGVMLRLMDSGNELLREAQPELLAEIESLAAMVEAAEGVAKLPLMEDYNEDFTQYKPRSYYAASADLSAYFRAMMWAGRLTFRTKSQADTITGLFVLKALRDGGALEAWGTMDETLAWLVGPVDDLSPTELLPISEQIFGADLSAEALGDPALLAAYIEALKTLPGPRVNSLPLPVGIDEEDLDEFTRGFRVFGQRFTFDAYIFQSLIYPAVGEFQQSRVLPMGEDVAAVLGSDLAFVETDKAGATDYLHYTDNVARLRGEINGISAEAWSENLYGAWLHALQPLAAPSPALLPPLMQTDAWKYKDMNTLLGSLAELKHATLLYAEQAYGGFGGGGYVPPVVSYTLVEPNPLVFARVAVIARQLGDGLLQRGFDQPGGLISSVLYGSSSLASLSAEMAEIARKEIAGEPVTYDEYYYLQERFASELWQIRTVIEESVPDAPDRMALIADVASNPTVEKIYYMATGDADLIYVVASGPFGLHLTRGAVYSAYLFEDGYDERIDDDQWRTRVASGDLPARPPWVTAYRAE